MGSIYKEQKELDPLPTINNPSLLTTKGSKPTSRKEKKLIVLNNFTSLKTCCYVMREMKDASVDIIVVSNELFCKEEMAKDFDKHFSRGCNIIEVTSLQPISIMQRIVYALLEKNSFVARDADHIVFTLLSEYSRGAATIVHMLTSLMQKSEDNSRTGFELAKQQLKHHIAHRKLEQSLNGYATQLTLHIADSTVSVKKKYHDENVITEMEPQIVRTVDNYYSSSEDNSSEDNSSEDNSSDNLKITNECYISNECFVMPSCIYKDSQKEIQMKASKDKELDATSSSANTTSGFVSINILNESCIMPHIDEESSHGNNDPCSDKAPCQDDTHNDSNHHSDDGIQSEGSNTSSSSTHASMHTQVHATSVSGGVDFVAGNDNMQIDSSDLTQLPTTAKPSKEQIAAAHKHPLYMYINDILTYNTSCPAHHLLHSLVIAGPIPLPLFYVEELNNVVMNTVIGKAESPMKQLVKAGVIRTLPYPMVYNKNLNPDYIDTTIQTMFIPRLIYDAVKDQMDDVDKALSVISVQRALEKLLMNQPTSLIHLRYILILCNHLDDICGHVSDHLLTTNLKQKLRILQKLRL